MSPITTNNNSPFLLCQVLLFPFVRHGPDIFVDLGHFRYRFVMFRVHNILVFRRREELPPLFSHVDDVFSTGLNVGAVLARLRSRLKRNKPTEVRLAALWYKPSQTRTDLTPDYYQNKTDNWLVLPYEVDCLTPDELAQNKPAILKL